MTISSLNSPQALEALVQESAMQAQTLAKKQSTPKIVVSPYRFNPLGAHIDHQGGQVLARSLNQYTILCYWPSESAQCTVRAKMPQKHWEESRFSSGELNDDHGWDSMARASLTALNDFSQLDSGIDAVVFGTMVSCGLSSSASVILAYLAALADVNGRVLSQVELVELCRRVENDYRGLNNGIQDQMSIVFGESNSLVLLDVEKVAASHTPDPAAMAQYRFLMCYSGVSRDLGGSSFNTRVAECQEAARLLHADAKHLGQVPLTLRTAEKLNTLPQPIRGRAKHVYSEMARVKQGVDAWQRGDAELFGRLMDESCQSSINDYESGSEWLIALHEFAREIPGVFGNRFSGGGYGGCLFMLVDVDQVDQIATTLLEKYLGRYPELSTRAKVLIAEAESTVRIL